MNAPRSFVVSLAPDVRAIVTVAIEYDISLPSPLEPEQWVAGAPLKMQIREALATLHCAPDLARHEIAFKREPVARAHYAAGTSQDIHKATPQEVPA